MITLKFKWWDDGSRPDMLDVSPVQVHYNGHTLDSTLIMAADTVAGYLKALLEGVEFRRNTYTLDPFKQEKNTKADYPIITDQVVIAAEPADRVRFLRDTRPSGRRASRPSGRCRARLASTMLCGRMLQPRFAATITLIVSR